LSPAERSDCPNFFLFKMSRLFARPLSPIISAPGRAKTSGIYAPSLTFASRQASYGVRSVLSFRTLLSSPTPPHSPRLFTAASAHSFFRRPPQKVFSFRTYSTQPPAPSLSERFKQLSKEYGKSAILVYVTMSSMSFTAITVALWNGVDVEGYLNKARATIGFPTPETQTPTERTKQSDSLLVTAVVAFSLNKLLSPLKILVTLWLTPRLARFIKRLKK
jgi:hypothetical protein